MNLVVNHLAFENRRPNLSLVLTDEPFCRFEFATKFSMQPAHKVLIADDHVDSAEILQEYLLMCGYEAFIARNGEEALDRAYDLTPRFLLLEVSLPRLNGFQVAARLRQSQQFDESVIIAHSGYGVDEYYDEARASGMDFYLLKPAEPALLLSLLSPEQNPTIIAANTSINVSRNLIQRSGELIAKAQALSLRSATIVKSAQDVVERSASARQSRRLKKSDQ